MAKILNKDPSVFIRERDAFTRDLQHFHDTRGTKFRRLPLISGREIDLFLLYNLVTAKGGWVKVTNKNEWETLLEHFNLPSQCVNSGVALKQVYIRFLDRYEKVHYLGEEADRGSDDDEDSRHKRWSARAMHSVPLTYNHHQHNIAESTRSYNGLSTDLFKPSDYDRLLLSLISPLPNEQDFAINVCTLLSNEGKHHLKLQKCSKIVDYLLAHAGIFNHTSLRPLFTHVYHTLRKQPLASFWGDTIVNEQLLDLTNETKFTRRKTVLPVLGAILKKETEAIKKEQSPADAIAAAAATVTSEQINSVQSTRLEEIKIEDFIDPEPCCSKTVTNSESIADRLGAVPPETEGPALVNVNNNNECIAVADVDDSDLFAPASDEFSDGKQKFKLKLELADRELFCTGRTLGTQEYIGQRVLQIANILRNLSFTEENVSVLANNVTFLRFILLCSNSRWNNLHQHGFDMLTNVAAELLVKDPIRDRLTECLLITITQGLSSEDRFVIISSLDVLNKLCQNEANEDVLLRYLEQNVFDQVCLFLTLHDIMLLVYTLECLYALSSLGERACNCITRVHGVIDVLVALITVEAQSYGPKACIGMKVVETVPPGGAVIAPPPPPPITTIQPATPTITNLTNCPPLTSLGISTPINTSSIVTPIYTSPPIPSATPVSKMNTNSSTPQRNSATYNPTPLISQPPVSLTPQQQHQPIQPVKVPIQPLNHNVQQQHAHQQAIQENEQFALAWLRATFEPDGRGKVEQQELYRNYLNSCSKIGRKGVIAPLHFPRCVRSTFGGTVGPNPSKTDSLQYYEGIKMRAQPLTINCYTPATQPVAPPRPFTPNKNVSKRSKLNVPVIQTSVNVATTESNSNDIMATPPPSPASPILKAQLSAPCKKETSPSKADTLKTQASAHPHLSQALLGAATTPTPVATGSANGSAAVSKEGSGSGNAQSSSSLIKSLLATKVNDCMTMPASMRTTSVVTTECLLSPAPHAASVVTTQVTQRQQQQRLLAAQLQSSPQPVIQTNKTAKSAKIDNSSKNCRINGARSQSTEILDNLVTSSTTVQTNQLDLYPNITTNRNSRNSQAIPPPLAPLSMGARPARVARFDIEDSDSTGNNSAASSSGLGTNQLSLADDGENSLTSFEELLNGIPNSLDIDAPCNEDSNSNLSGAKPKAQSLMLADLLEKKIDKKEPPLMNGVLRIGDKGLELVENHIDKVLMSKDVPNITPTSDSKISVIVSSEDSELTEAVQVLTNNCDVNSVISNSEMDTDSTPDQQSLKRSADDFDEVQAKRPHLSSVIVPNSNINGTIAPTETPNVTPNGEDTEVGSVSLTAANLYAALAADVLDEEDLEEELPQPMQVQPQFTQVLQTNKIVNAQPNPSQLIVHTGNRQIIVSQPQVMSPAGTQMIFTTSGQLIQQIPAGASAIKNSTGHQTMPMLVQTAQPGNQQRVMLSQVPQGVQLVGAQGGQYVISSGNVPGQTTYVMAQPQTAIVQGQTQTVLVAQTTPQQGSASKTIIILQPQTASQQTHQKVVLTPQGQSVVMTQVPRPVLQTSTLGNATAFGQTQQTVITANTSNCTPTIIRNVQSPPPVAIVAQTNIQNSVNKVIVNPSTQTTSNPPTRVIANGASSKTTTSSVTHTVDNKQTRTSGNQVNIGQRTIPIDALFVCEWKGCSSRTGFKSANEVLLHAVDAHCPTGSEEIQCLWERCDNMKRKRFSLMTHLIDRHCNLEAMKLSAVRRKQLAQGGRPELAAPVAPPPHPGYAPDAALHAIKRHALEFVNPKELMQRSEKQGPAVSSVPPHTTTGPTDQVSQEQLMDDNEGPVTKSIRLTASLILRNLVIYSNNSRRFLRHYEPHLASVALSNVESSRTIAQVLYDLNDNASRR